MNSLIQPHTFAHRQAMHAFPLRAEQEQNVCRNYLFLVGHQLSKLDRQIVNSTAHKLASHGYVYVADVEQDCVEDRDDIRYLPLRDNNLPHFGSVTIVAVLHDNALARLAAQTYPDATVYVIDHDFSEQGSRCVSCVVSS
jgi:hypothetical protein